MRITRRRSVVAYIIHYWFLGHTGADVAAANKGGRVALHYAASKGHVAIADLLLKRGAKINQKDKVLPSCNIFYLTLDFCTGSLSQNL
jgi:hypothetical protein